MKSVFAFALLLMFISACGNIDKMIDRGDYDTAINKLVKKLEGKKDRKKEYVLKLEYAFQKAQESDLKNEKALRSENQNANWTRIYDIHNRIAARQLKIEPFLPLISSDGYQATFKFINIDELRIESKKNTADFYYQTALTLIDEARSSLDKNAARKAHDYLTQIDALFTQYKDKEQLKKIAYNLGQENYLLKITNETRTIIPQDIEKELLKVSVEGLNRKFKNYDVQPDPTIQYDHYIQLTLQHIDFSPERERSRIYEDINEVESEQTIMDKNGKPKKDSLGKVIKQKVKTKYTSDIEEITQSKSVVLSGRLEYLHSLSGTIEFTKPIQVEGLFENKLARLIKGDREYVSSDCRKKLNGKLMNFPSNEDLLVDASEKMKKIVKDIIQEREK
jgi:hypothetical protein